MTRTADHIALTHADTPTTPGKVNTLRAGLWAAAIGGTLNSFTTYFNMADPNTGWATAPHADMHALGYVIGGAIGWAGIACGICALINLNRRMRGKVA